MNKVAVITGAGSGVGRATVVRLVKEGWTVIATARNSDVLADTVRVAGGGERCHPFVCTVGDLAETKALADFVLGKFGRIDLLVNSAGTNVPKRSLEILSNEDYHLMLNSNLNGAYYLIQAFLPSMRKQKTGNIVNIVSDAAKAASPKAGPAYVISKFGMLGLTQSINAEERNNGIRACAILPGDIDTPLLDKRPSPPAADARSRMLQPEDVAECVMLAVNLPDRAVVEELLLRPR